MELKTKSFQRGAQKTLMIFGGVSMIAVLLLIAYKTRMR